jgi:hypothetical protein
VDQEVNKFINERECTMTFITAAFGIDALGGVYGIF